MDMFTSYGHIRKPKQNRQFFNDFSRIASLLYELSHSVLVDKQVFTCTIANPGRNDGFSNWTFFTAAVSWVLMRLKKKVNKIEYK